MKTLLTKYARQLATALSVLALILFIPAGLSASLGLRIFLAVVIVLLLVGSVALLYAGHRRAQGIVNYFLYDPETETKLSRADLDFEIVDRALLRYLDAYVEDPALLWDEIPQRLRIRLGEEGQFYPLVAYRMLLALSPLSPREIRTVFCGTEDRIVSYVCRALADTGDKEMADYLFDLKRNRRSEEGRIVGFFKRNKAFFEGRILDFVKENLSEFDFEREDKAEERS